MSATQLVSFEQSQQFIGTMKNKVFLAIKANPDSTRFELSEILSARLSSVVGRVNELLKEKRIMVSGTKHDDQSDRDVETLVVVEL